MIAPMTSEQRLSILKYWQLLECFAWQSAPALDDEPRVRSLVAGLPWPEQTDATCRWLVEQERPKKRVESVTWQHSVFLGITSERNIVEELFRGRVDELELLPRDFRGAVPMLVINAGTQGIVGEQSADGVDLPAFDPESLEIARWPWALAQWIRSNGKPDAWADDFEEFRDDVAELCREAVLRTKPDGKGVFRLTADAIGSIQAGLLDIVRKRSSIPPGNPLPPVFAKLHAPRVESRFRSDPNATFDPPLLNSFFVDDLSRAVADASKGELGGVLDRYVAMSTGLEKVELDRSKPGDPAAEQKRWREVFASFSASSLPQGTWPKPSSRQLYFAQQLACNRILMGREREEIVGVNGPPGTGKTTLLRDVIAEILVRRAEKLADLATASDAFGKKEGTPPRTFYRVGPELRGFEIVVASQNNAAVENITRELPNIDDFCLDSLESDRDKKSPQEKAEMERRIIADIDHFAEISDAILKAGVSATEANAEQSDRDLRPSWGLISAPLGNKARRNIVANALFPYLKSGAASPFLRAVIVKACTALGRDFADIGLDQVDRKDRAAVEALKREIDALLGSAQAKFEADFSVAQTEFRQALEKRREVQEELQMLERRENDHTICANRRREHERELPKLVAVVDTEKMDLLEHQSAVREAELKYAKADRDCRNAQSLTAWRRSSAGLETARRQHAEADGKLASLQDQLVEFVARAEQIAFEAGQAKGEADQAGALRPRGLARLLKAWVKRLEEAECRYQSAQARFRSLCERHDSQRAGIGAISAQIESTTPSVRRFAGTVAALEIEEAKLRTEAERVKREAPALLAARDLDALLIQIQAAAKEAKTALAAARHRAAEVAERLKTAETKWKGCEQEIAQSKARLSELSDECRTMRETLGIRGTIRWAYVLGERERQAAKPLMGERVHRARMDVFVAALRLHRAFALAALPQLRRNLSFACDVLWGTVEPDEVAFVGDAWTSLSFLIPVVSTTFASASRLFAKLKPGSLGWAMIDEAGQAPPQYAVGLLRLVRRCVVVGDPLQLPPVVPMPATVTEHLRTCCGVSDASLHAHDCSVQMIADRVTTLGSEVAVPSTKAPERRLWVGCPLYVHNRCAEPIFTISNALSYGGRMVLGRGAAPKPPISPVIRPLDSYWLDVARPENTEAHATADDLAAVTWLLKSFRWHEPSHLYIISPFRDVRDKVQDIAGHGPKVWRENSIGTVHTFQGKQADCVILVLGGRSGGARRWAGKPANLLNVAASRAKESLIVVGSFDRWKDYVAPFSVLNRIAWRRELQTLSLDAAGIPVGEVESAL